MANSVSLLSAADSDVTTLADRLVSEGLIGLAPAAKLFGKSRNEKARHPSTLTRYFHDGVKLADGRVVRLECLRVGSQLMTSRAAVLRFLAAQQSVPGENDVGSEKQVTPNIRRRQADAATAELNAILS